MKKEVQNNSLILSGTKSTFILIFIFFLSLTIKELNANEQGVKYLKLANSYLQLNDLKNAEKYLEISSKNIEKSDVYWQAYLSESKGYFYIEKYFVENDKEKRDQLKNLALANFKNAKTNYDNSVKMPDGSNSVIEKIIKQIEIDINSFKSESREQKNTTLNLDNQKLKELGALDKNITNFSAAGNKFKQIPKELIGLKDLTYLNLSNNKVSVITDYIAEFKKIEYLNLSNNNIKEVSDNLMNLQELRVLDLSNNKLKKVPLSLCSLKNLQVLNLKGNKLSFEEVKSLIMCLKNTNIIIDKFEKVETGDEIQEDVMFEP